MLVRVFLLLFMMLVYSSCIWANDKDNYLWLAKTSGTWKADNGTYGYYRGMVYRRLGETGASDKVVIDILEQKTSGERLLKKEVVLPSPGYAGYVEDIFFKKITEKIMAIQLDIEMNGMGGVVLREVYLISPAGIVKRITRAQYQDIYEPTAVP